MTQYVRQPTCTGMTGLGPRAIPVIAAAVNVSAICFATAQTRLTGMWTASARAQCRQSNGIGARARRPQA